MLKPLDQFNSQEAEIVQKETSTMAAYVSLHNKRVSFNIEVCFYPPSP